MEHMELGLKRSDDPFTNSKSEKWHHMALHYATALNENRNAIKAQFIPLNVTICPRGDYILRQRYDGLRGAEDAAV